MQSVPGLIPGDVIPVHVGARIADLDLPLHDLELMFSISQNPTTSTRIVKVVAVNLARGLVLK
jgi:hypothetical protein